MNLTPIQQLEAAIREHPANAELYLQLTPLYLEKGRDYEAEKLLAKGAAASEDLRVRELWEDVTLARLARNMALAEQRVELQGTVEARAALVEERAERERVETAIFASRCQRNPDDAQSRYELGRRLQSAGKLTEASAEFERALADPALRSPAALVRGECLRQLNQVPDALKHFRLAAAAAQEPQQVECKKQSLRQAVELARLLKLPKLADRYESELAQIDSHYSERAIPVMVASA